MGIVALRKLLGALVLTAVVLAVAGCGGSKSSAPPTAPSVTISVANTTPATTTTAAPTTSTSGGATTGAGSLKSCTSLSGFGTELSKALAAGAAAGSGNADLTAQAAAFKSFVSHAPAEIRPQFQIIADAIEKYAAALQGAHLKPGQVPSADVLAKLQAASKSISQPAVAAASQKISAWVQSHCHA